MGDDFKIYILLIKDRENPKSEEINRRDWDWNFLKNLKKPGKKRTIPRSSWSKYLFKVLNQEQLA